MFCGTTLQSSLFLSGSSDLLHGLICGSCCSFKIFTCPRIHNECSSATQLERRRSILPRNCANSVLLKNCTCWCVTTDTSTTSILNCSCGLLNLLGSLRCWELVSLHRDICITLSMEFMVYFRNLLHLLNHCHLVMHTNERVDNFSRNCSCGMSTIF